MSVPEASVEQLKNTLRALQQELSKVVVGQTEVINSTLISLLAGGHVLLEGVPGLGKTLLVRTLADALDLQFSRIQFTPDLMPADLVGTNIVANDSAGNRVFRFVQGPVFANIVLADEINRATPKTQSALLEAMQEHTVTIANTTHRLPDPFFVLATQNPLEMEGTYPLPEAQLDRFFFHIKVVFPSEREMVEIITRTTSSEQALPDKAADGTELLRMRNLARDVPVASHIASYAARLVLGTHPDCDQASPLVKRYVRYGASPRGAQTLVLAAKVGALASGRFNVAHEDIRAVAHPALRHRVILNFEANVDGINTDQVIDSVIDNLDES